MCAVCSVHDCMCIYISYMRILTYVYIYITCIICVIRCVCDLHHIMQWFLCASPSCWYYFACMTIFKMGVIKHSENVGFPLAPLLSAFSQTVELEDAPRASHPTASDLTGHRTWIGVWCCQKHSFRNYSVTASLRAHCPLRTFLPAWLAFGDQKHCAIISMALQSIQDDTSR